MSQQGGAWQTATNRPRNSQSSSRTPQNRSNTASPSQQGQPTQAPKPANNVWTNRSSTPSGVNGPTKGDVTPAVQAEVHHPLNGFNADEVKAFLDKGPSGHSYKVTEVGAAGGRTGGGGAWGAKPNTMANGQPFFVQLAKQVAATEGGG